MAATGLPKLKLMLNEDCIFMRTQIDVQTVREYLQRTDNSSPDKAVHPAQILSQKNQAEDENSKEDDAQSRRPGSEAGSEQQRQANL